MQLISLKKGFLNNLKYLKNPNDKDDISQLTNSFYEYEQNHYQLKELNLRRNQ